MLQNIGEGVRGWFGKVIVVLVSISFAVWGISYYLQSRTGVSAVVAKVASVKITNQQVQDLLRAQQYTIERERGALNASELSSLKQQVLEHLISQAVLNQSLKKLELVAPTAVVESVIASNKNFQINGRYSYERLQQVLAANNISLKSLMANVAQDLERKQLKVGISLSAFALAPTVERFYQWANQLRSYRYAVVKPAAFLSAIQPTPSQVKSYYESTQSAYKLPDRASLSYVVLDPSVLAKQVVLPAKQVRAYYDANVSQFRLSANYRFAEIVVAQATDEAGKAKAAKESTAINHALAGGARISAVAKHWGGETRSVSAADLNEALRAQLQQMAPGQQILAQQIPAGTIWLELISVTPGKAKSFASVSTKIRHMLESRAVSAKMAPLSEKLSELSYTQSESLKAASKALNLPIQTTPLLPRTGAKSGLFSNKKLMTAAFGDEVLKQGNNSLPVALPDGSVIVLRLKHFEKSMVKPLADVRTQVLAAMKGTQAQLEAGQLADTLTARLNAKQSVAKLMASHKLVWVERADVSRLDKQVGTPEGVQHAVFGELAVGASQALTLDDGSSVVVNLQSVRLPAGKLAQQKKQDLGKMAASFYGQMDLQAVLTSVVKTIPVKRYPERMM